MSAKMKITHRDSNGKLNSEIFYTSLKANIDSDTATAVDTWSRAFVALSKDTYDDTQIIETTSITEVIAE